MLCFKQIAIFVGVVTLVSDHICAVAKESSLKVETQNGWVLGTKLSDSLYSWKGIPYAKPPLDNLRFEPPEEPRNWTATWDATYDRNQCVMIQASVIGTYINPIGTEDCLYINIYAPRPPSRNHSLLSVMIWFYDGGFLQENSTDTNYEPTQLVAEGVIVVRFNYRLGIFGFLSTGDKIAPGNTGLRDQLFALNWVKRNIHAFGGDPDNITAFGPSAGAVSIIYLLLKPSRGLFKQAILESGSPLCPWALSRTARKAAFATGVHLGIITTDSDNLVSRFKKIPADDLQRAAFAAMATILAADPLNGLVFAPVIEVPSDDAIVTGSSYEKLKRGDFNHVPIIIGYNSYEGYYFKDEIKFLSLYATRYDAVPSGLVPLSMKVNVSDLSTVGTEIRNHYVGGIGTIVLPNSHLLRYFGDSQLVRPIQQTVKFLSKFTVTYMYKLSYRHKPSQPGVGHTEELQYLFDSNRNSINDKFIKTCLTRLWTNFAKFSNPTPPNFNDCGRITWKPVAPNDTNSLSYLNIDTQPTVGVNPNKVDMDFWNDLFKKYGNPPYLTY